MRIIKKLYLMICRKVGPRGLTYSAYAWKYATETGDHSLRIRIDGLFMLLAKQCGHCQQQYQRETSTLTD